MAKFRENSTQPAAPWIYNSWLDLIVGCGAWSAPLLLLSYSTVSSSARTWSVVFYVLAFFFNYPHYMATLYRAYRRSADSEKYRVFTLHITALVVLALLLSHFWARLLPWAFLTIKVELKPRSTELASLDEQNSGSEATLLPVIGAGYFRYLPDPVRRS